MCLKKINYINCVSAHFHEQQPRRNNHHETALYRSSINNNNNNNDENDDVVFNIPVDAISDNAKFVDQSPDTEMVVADELAAIEEFIQDVDYGL